MVDHVERAYRAWPILAGRAHSANTDSTITYGELANQLGIHHRAVGYVLGIIQDYCLREQLPPLTILVINRDTRKPGPGFIAWDVEDLTRGLEEVRAFAWQAIPNPFLYASDGTTEDELIEQLVKHPDAAAEVFARIKVRGTAQAIFRSTLLRVYPSGCAFCGLTFEAALEACHLIPWPEASAQERMDPRNGLLLCSTHHKLVDAGYMTISRSGIVTYRYPGAEDGPYSNSDKAIALSMHGKAAALPESKLHRPSHHALIRHHKIGDWGDLP